MLLLDDILLLPVRGLLSIFREIHKAAMAEQRDTRPIVQELQELYMRLETGKISEEEFAKQERVLLDRLQRAEES